MFTLKEQEFLDKNLIRFYAKSENDKEFYNSIKNALIEAFPRACRFSNIKTLIKEHFYEFPQAFNGEQMRKIGVMNYKCTSKGIKEYIGA